MSVDIKLEWRSCLARHITILTEKFTDCDSDKQRLKLCWETVKNDNSFNDIVDRLKKEVKNIQENYEVAREYLEKCQDSIKEDNVLPALAKGEHSKIANGSTLIQMKFSESQGRYLQARELIKAGDVLILERPYAAVLVQENKETHCSYCFNFLKENIFECPNCKIKHCSLPCWKKAWLEYHKNECCLKPLLEILGITSHLAVRVLLVTGKEQLSKFLKEYKGEKASAKLSYSDKIQGCTSEGLYPGDYRCVYNLVTNTELQPTHALVSYALDSALMTDVAFDFIYGGGSKVFEKLERNSVGITKEIMGCLLLHHMEQMPCNIHAITAVVSELSTTTVSKKEQRRIASAIYPTASLLNHACDPDVIVSFIGRHLVVRATHNIKPNEEIAHCYGPSASRMTRKVRQSLLQKQYFFICGCSACKSDENLEEQCFYNAEFICQECSSKIVISQETSKILGKCVNKKCRRVKDFSSEIQTMKDCRDLFEQALQYLESENFEKSVFVLKECLKKRQGLLQKFDKDVAETHDALARCYASLGDFRQATFHCEQSTESVRKRFGQESIEYGHELHKFSQLLFNGRYINKAIPVIDNAICLLSIHYGGYYSDVQELQQMKKTLKEYVKGKT